MTEKDEQVRKSPTWNPLAAHVVEMLANPVGGENAAIFSTTGVDGSPHAAWMGAVASPDHRTLYTLTSPDSGKIVNIQHNPKVEWMLVDDVRETVVYLLGTANILDDISEMKRVWHMFPDKSRAYFLSFFNSAPGYAVIETQIQQLRVVRPKEGRECTFPPDALSE